MQYLRADINLYFRGVLLQRANSNINFRLHILPKKLENKLIVGFVLWERLEAEKYWKSFMTFRQKNSKRYGSRTNFLSSRTFI